MGPSCIICDKVASSGYRPDLLERVIHIFKKFDNELSLESDIADSARFCEVCAEKIDIVWEQYEALSKLILDLKTAILFTKPQNSLKDDLRPRFRRSLVRDLCPQVRLSRTEEGSSKELVEKKNIKEEEEFDYLDNNEDFENPAIDPLDYFSGNEVVEEQDSSDPEYRLDPSLDSDIDEEKHFVGKSQKRSKIKKPRQKQTESSESPDKKIKKRVRKKKGKGQDKPEFDSEGNKIIRLITDADGKTSYGGVEVIQVDEDPNEKEASTTKGRHFSKDVKFKCGQCARVVKGKFNIQSHIKEIHLGIRRFGYRPLHPEKVKKIKLDSIRTFDNRLILHGVEIKSTEDGMFECGECAVKHKRRCNLINHIRWIHAKIERPVVADKRKLGPRTELQTYREKSVRLEDGRQFFCNIEMLTLEGEDVVEKHVCSKCGFGSKQKANLMTHIKKYHMEHLPFKCPDCDKSFGYLHLLRMHSISHKTEKSQVCHQCGKQCKQRNSLLEHIRRVHQKVINHNCKFCGKGYFSKKDMNVHLKTHYKQLGYQEESHEASTMF